MMDKRKVTAFMENFGPNSVADACVLWLIRKYQLYFQPFSQGAVRWLLLDFSKKNLDSLDVISWMKENSHNINKHKQLTDELWETYCLDIIGSGVENTDSIHDALRVVNKERRFMIMEQKWMLRKMLKSFYDETLPLIITAKREAFESQLDIEAITRDIETILNELGSKQSKEEYVESIFKEYSNSLYNRILISVKKSIAAESESKMDFIKSAGRQEHMFNRFSRFNNFERNELREQKASNKLLCMMTSTHPVPAVPTPSDVIVTQLGAYSNPLAQLGDALNVFLNSNNIIFNELKDKLGISVDVKININFPNSVLPEVHELPVDLQPVLSSDGCLHLPTILDTPKARDVFQKAIDKGFIIPTVDGKLEWRGIDQKGNNSQLAYLCEKIYGGDYDYRGNNGKSMPFTDLERVFNVKKMSSTLQQVYYAKREQSWRASIDQLFL